jgi:hypothetical protein
VLGEGAAAEVFCAYNSAASKNELGAAVKVLCPLQRITVSAEAYGRMVARFHEEAREDVRKIVGI